MATAAALITAMIARGAFADETCRYSGSASHSATISVETKAVSVKGETTVDVMAHLDARAFGVLDWRYLYQEIGAWHAGELRTIGVNHRYRFAGFIRRQQWDYFTRDPDGMKAWRVQAKTLSDFQQKHPGFVRHWDLSSFGEPWLPDYVSAPPERRADLDLPAAQLAPGLGTPMTMAFYWVRWAAPAARAVPVFLPGFKKAARADIQIAPVGVEANGLLHFHSSIRYPELSQTEDSTGDAWITPDHHLARVTFTARSRYGSAEGDLHLDGCQGTAAAP
jgi:hypothetical protein